MLPFSFVRSRLSWLSIVDVLVNYQETSGSPVAGVSQLVSAVPQPWSAAKELSPLAVYSPAPVSSG